MGQPEIEVHCNCYARLGEIKVKLGRTALLMLFLMPILGSNATAKIKANFAIEYMARVGNQAQITLVYDLDSHNRGSGFRFSSCEKFVIDVRYSEEMSSVAGTRHKDALTHLETAYQQELSVSFVLLDGQLCEPVSHGIDYSEDPDEDVYMSFAVLPQMLPERVKGLGPIAKAATEYRIHFDDGSSIDVEWRPKTLVDGYQLPPVSSDDHEDLLYKASLGDPVAAFQLSELLTECRGAHESEAELEEAIAHARKTLEIRKPTFTWIARGPQDLERAIHTSLLTPYEKCLGLGGAEKEEAEEWLRIAADAGIVKALTSYSRQFADDYKTAAKYLTKAWEAGDAKALTGLTSVYSTAWYQLRERGSPPGNLVRAYASFYAYYKLLGASQERHTAGGLMRAVNAIEGNLSADEIKEGRRRAQQMIVNNENCCLEM